MKYGLLRQFGNDVADQDVAFLNTRGVIRGHTDTVINRVLELSPRATGQCDRVQTLLPGYQ
jgi:hypothetical protein